ncbi:MAG: hypothetical protein EP338_01835 [Bacteroidetes bacterium]|nr:MAG: hypothetical protein EP338_01835 [Bacteroidota bacterium]
MMINLSVAFKKFSLPAIFFSIGIVMVVVGFSTNQQSLWYMASLLVIIAGALSLTLSGGFLKTQLGKILGYGAGAAAIIAIVLSWSSVKETSRHNELYKSSFIVVQENLSNVRIAQKAYHEKHGVYAHTWAELENFIKSGTIAEVKSEGYVPARKLTPEERDYIYKDNRAIDNNMTELEAYILSKNPQQFPEFADFKRDTIQVPFLKKQFGTTAYQERRKKANLGPFIVDSLKYIPYTGGREEFEMAAKDNVVVGKDSVAVLEVKGKLPFAKIHGSKKREEIFFGSLTLPDLTGSWE